MALRFYILPVDGDGVTAAGFYPKYIGNGGIVGGWCAIDYGKEPTMIVAAEVTAAEHTSISANVDIIAVPANLDLQIGANLATVQSALESKNLPADWVTASMTYRTVLKWVLRICLLLQRFRGLDAAAARFFDLGLTLDSLVGDLSASVRQRLNDAATSFGLDTSSITLSTTIRAALRILGQQMTFSVLVKGEAI
jgi:hypothetical protein